MDDNINNFMVDSRIRFLENRDNNSRWCDPDVSENFTIFFVKWKGKKSIDVQDIRYYTNILHIRDIKRI